VNACSEIGVDWFLFLRRSQNTFIERVPKGLIHVEAGLRPFLSILGMAVRTAFSCEDFCAFRFVKKECGLVQSFL